MLRIAVVIVLFLTFLVSAETNSRSFDSNASVARTSVDGGDNPNDSGQELAYDVQHWITSDSAGHPIPLSAFGSCAALEVLGLDGELVAIVAKDEARLPISVKPGLYELRVPSSFAKPNIILIR